MTTATETQTGTQNVEQTGDNRYTSPLARQQKVKVRGTAEGVSSEWRGRTATVTGVSKAEGVADSFQYVSVIDAEGNRAKFLRYMLSSVSRALGNG